MRVPLLILLGLSLSCQGQQVQSQKKEEPIQVDCFEQLHPNRQEGAYLTGVTYQHGACKDGYKALNKFAYTEEVKLSHTDKIDRLDDLESSKVYVDDDKTAYVKYEGEKIVIGKIKEQGVEAELDVQEDVQYGYYYNKDGEVRKWTLEQANDQGESDKGAVVVVNDKFK